TRIMGPLQRPGSELRGGHLPQSTGSWALREGAILVTSGRGVNRRVSVTTEVESLSGVGAHESVERGMKCRLERTPRRGDSMAPVGVSTHAPASGASSPT